MDPKTYFIFFIELLTQMPNGGTQSFSNIVITSFGFTSLQSTLINIPYSVLTASLIAGTGWLAGRYQTLNCFLIIAVVIPCVVGAAVIVCWRLRAVARSRREHASVVRIVHHQQPPPVLSLAQPVVHQLEHVRLRLLAPAHLDQFSDLAEALLQPRRVARVRPQYPRLRRAFGGAIAVLDSQLRLAATALVVVAGWGPLCRTYPTPPRPTSATRDAGAEHRSPICSSSVAVPVTFCW